jgi:hypothetical protein
MSVGVMRDYHLKLRDLHVSHTLGVWDLGSVTVVWKIRQLFGNPLFFLWIVHY